jgi:hypothetical protein
VRLDKDLREFVALLNSRNVEFVVVGAHALAFHGHPRYTGDLDLLVRPSLENGRRVATALVDFGFASFGLTEDNFANPDQIIQLGYPPNRIDLLTSISGITFDEVWQSRENSTLDGIPVSYIGRNAFVRNKIASGRLKDAADVEALGESI